MKETQWEIEYYIPSPGRLSPLVPFIEGLSEKSQSKLSYVFSLIKEFGTKVGLPHIKKLQGTPLWELRILGQDSVRIFYVIVERQNFLLLHGFVKKKTKTPRKEIETALSRLKEYKLK